VNLLIIGHTMTEADLLEQQETERQHFGIKADPIQLTIKALAADKLHED